MLKVLFCIALATTPTMAQPFLAASGRTWLEGAAEVLMFPEAVVDQETIRAALVGMPIADAALVVIDLGAPAVWTTTPGVGLAADLFSRVEDGVVVSNPSGAFTPVPSGSFLAPLVARHGAVALVPRCPRQRGCPADVDPTIFADGFEDASTDAWTQ